ncbi:MAG: hypothetical protein HYR56_20135 [Acidobacteria bacterium]|nr:hypothetical protein [Acidobacteriota bacterium]MBI3424602.1 hypothetical protein [Acidobacteriota bacterium]
MKFISHFWPLVLLGLCYGLAWNAPALSNRRQSATPLWQPLTRAERLARGVAGDAPVWQLNAAALQQLLASTPLEFKGAPNGSQTILPLPLPDGGLAHFKIEESPLLEPALAAQFPAIKSYRGQALDVPGLTMRAAWSPAGLHATLLVGGAVTTLFPAPQDPTLYFSQTGAAEVGSAACLAQEAGLSVVAAETPDSAIGEQLRTYRIAIAATWEYANAFGNGTNAGTLASINIWLNGLDAIYERDLSVRLTLASGTNVLFTTERGFNAGNDPFENANVLAMMEQLRPVLRDQVGVNNYDLGHVLGASTGFNNQGSAGFGVVCDNKQFNPLTGTSDLQGPNKGRGATTLGVSYPVGDSRPLGIWAHEVGHQFGAHHSYNTANGFCGSQRNSSTAYEPGGGTTLMAYIGVCDTDNVTLTRDMRFHNGSVREILAYLNTAACGTIIATANRAPTVNGGPDFTIPKQTPFTLTATGTDADAGDVANLTYSWDQVDAGETAFVNPPYGDQASDPPTTTRPLFRSFAATANPARTFPSLTYILNNANTPPATLNGLQTAEALPRVPRMLNFRVTVYDQRGGVNEDAVKLTVDNSGPFAVTLPNTAVNWTGGNVQTVTWNVNGTQTLASNVRLLLSTDGGQSFPTVLLANTVNNGSAAIIVPNNVQTTQARLKVEALGNIFFDISDANFTITPGVSCPSVNSFTPAGVVGAPVTLNGANFTGVTALRFSNDVAAQFSVVSATQIDTRVPAGAVSGPLTLSKAGCNNVQTTSFIVQPCTFTRSPSAQGFTAAGGTGSVFVEAATPCNWTATSNAAWLTLTAGATGVGTGTVNYTVAANAGATRTGTLTVAGQTFTVTQLATQATLVNVSAASFLGGELAPESIASAFGTALSTATQSAPSLPLPTTLAGTQVKVRDSAGVERLAPLFFVSASQLNYQIPAGSAPGVALVTVSNASGALSRGDVILATVAPDFFSANANGRDVPAGVAVRARGTLQQFEPLVRLDPATNRYVTLPLDLGPTTDVVVAVLFGTGWRLRQRQDDVEVTLSGGTLPPVNATVSFASAAPGLVGLDQLNITLPRALAGRGVVDVVLNVEGKTANPIRLNIK